MKFDDHAQGCEQCTATPWNLCAAGRLALQADMDSIPPQLQRQADLDAMLGKQMAMRWIEGAVGREKQPHIIVHALAFTLAHLLTTYESTPSLQELIGGKPVTNEARFVLFNLEVKEHIKAIEDEKLRAMAEDFSFEHPDDDGEEP